MPCGEGGGKLQAVVPCSKGSADKLLKCKVINRALHPGCAAAKSVQVVEVRVHTYSMQLGCRLIKRESMSGGKNVLTARRRSAARLDHMTAFLYVSRIFSPMHPLAAGSGAPE